MLRLLAKHFSLLVFWSLLFALVAFGISFIFPPEYSAESKVLIISRDRTGVDPYTQAKSAERIGENLAEVMKTSDFYSKVLASNIVFNRQRWQALSDRDRRKQWQEDVKAGVVYGTSLLQVVAYAPTKDEAVRFSNAVTQTVTDHGTEYAGGDVSLKQVDTPLVSRFRARPNFVLNTIGGFLIGLFVSSLWVVRSKRHTLFS